MKGIVFTEFFEMIEEKFGLEMVDELINESDLESEGVYTSIGTYDFVEMQSLLTTLHKKTQIPVNDLLHTYALYFFDVLTRHHSDIFMKYKDPINFLESIEGHIHVHVRKIYPGAELPTFEVLSRDENSIKMIYKSERAMYMFSKGLMERTFGHFEKSADINMELLNDAGTEVKFTITMNNARA